MTGSAVVHSVCILTRELTLLCGEEGTPFLLGEAGGGCQEASRAGITLSLNK